MWRVLPRRCTTLMAKKKFSIQPRIIEPGNSKHDTQMIIIMFYLIPEECHES